MDMHHLIDRIAYKNKEVGYACCVPTAPSFLCLNVLESCLKQYCESFYTVRQQSHVLHTPSHQFGPGTCHTRQEETS